MASFIPRVLLAAAVIAAPLAACSGDDTTGSGGGGDSTTATTGTGMGGASTSTGTTSTSTTTSTGSGTPITCADGASTDIPNGECDLLQQDCPAGQTCKPVSSSGAFTTKCLPSNGLKTITKPCTQDSECAKGLFCIFDQCTPPCCPDNDEPCMGGTCNVNVAFGDQFAMFCTFLQQCELLTENACPPGNDCHLQDTKQGLAACTPPSGMVADEGGDCEFLNDCHDMQFCYAPDANTQPVCRWHCRPSDANMSPPGLGGCPQGETCQLFNFGVPDLGLCLPK